MILKNQTKDTVLAENCDIANSFIKRFNGLMKRDCLPNGHGLLIVPCNSIHMFFMKFPIDVIFLDKNFNVIFIIEQLMPWKFSKIIGTAHSVLELPVGTIEKTHTLVGDKVVKI